MKNPLHRFSFSAIFLLAGLVLTPAGAFGNDAEEDAMLAAISGRGGAPGGEPVHYFEADEKTVGYLALPGGKGPFPAVILIHEWDGVVERIKQTADAFAKAGYIALAADLYRGRTGSSRDENIALMQEARADAAAIIANLDAAVAYVRERAHSTGRVATVGWCFGGGIALSYALGGERHEGTAIFYGSLIDDPEEMAHVHHEIYGTFAGRDRSPSVEDVHAFIEAMRKAGIDNDVHVYLWLH